MAGPTSPGTEGPTFAPPHLPAGWIAQWDGSSKKYYFVQLSTGVSQWEVPTDAAPTGATPAQPSDHPYGVPQPELITHPDGSQTVRHADGTLEPVNPPMPPDNTNTRGLDGPTGDRGLGSNDYGYSNSASGGGGYSGQAPPTSYQPSGSTHTQHSSPPAGASSYHSPASNQGHNQQSYPPPPTQAQNHNQSFPPPPNQYSTPNQGQTHHNTAYAAPPQQSHNQYPPPPSGGPPSSYGQQHSYAAQSNQQQQQQYSGYNPATYGGGTPQGSQPGGYPSQPSYAGNSSQQGGYNTHY
ncbi:hypothetical protein K4K58_004303 [Colletotrichum sp. SAR11_239]|nr:hypothetical protein K4K58_004303 [Colletotrichum sp. SAR11_239]